VLYSQAVATAPAGSASFEARDVCRLARSTLALLFREGPASPPLQDVAMALGAPEPITAVLTPARADGLRRLAQSSPPNAEREAAGRRLVRGLFWFLVYELAPERWDALSRVEPVHPDLVANLPADGLNVLEIAAGSGRLTVPLAERAARLLAVEPCRPLRALLAGRLSAQSWVVGAIAERVPLPNGWADLVTSCASLGAEPPLGGEQVLAELERCCRPGGEVALVEPESPAWFQARGYELVDFGSIEAPACDPEVEAFFGKRTPPHRLLRKLI
jgi:SAM-dependent methyltransferase